MAAVSPQVIAEDLYRQMQSGRLPLGFLLPAEDELCRRYAAEADDVRAALADLRAAGAIEYRPNLGYVVASPPSPLTLRTVPRGRSSLTSSELVSLARSIGIDSGGSNSAIRSMTPDELFGRIKRELAAGAARHELVEDYIRGSFDSRSAVHQAILDYLYEADQAEVASAIEILRLGARDMLPGRPPDFDLFGPDGDEAVGKDWDVLQNYAQVAFGRARAEQERGERAPDEPAIGAAYPWDLIAASFDPAWRRALRDWQEHNADLVPGSGIASVPAFGYAAAGDLERYAREFADGSPAAEAALSAGRLPFPPGLVRRSPDLARLTARIWSLTSPDSPVHRQLFEAGRRDRDAPPLDDEQGTAGRWQVQASVSRRIAREDPAVFRAQPPRADEVLAASLSRSRPQAAGDRLERGMLAVFERLFRIAPDDFTLDAGGSPRPRMQLRRQQAGTQFGADLVLRFKGTALGAASTCLVECKNYTDSQAGLPVNIIADKVLQAEAGFDAEPVDHWILVSPHRDPNNELDRLIERWNATQRFPFTVQVWSPQSGVRDLFALVPDIYRGLYGTDPPEPGRDPDEVVADFAGRLLPPVRLPDRLRSYVRDPRSFVEPSEQGWLEQLPARIVRSGFDDKGARLPRPLEAEVLSVLVDSPAGSNVALLLGEFGEGKSFLTVSLCAQLRERYLRDPRAGSPVPVRLHLRGYRHVSAPADFLRTQLELAGLSMADWAELRRGNVLVILDGLDEMSVRQDPATTRANLDTIGSLLELLDGLPVLVTSRPHFFAASADRERFYDRLRRPHVFRMAQPDRRDTVAHLRAYADKLSLADKLNKIKELYDPIGLAGKVLFLEMIKKTLPELPEDHFDELVLYETYVRGSLARKIELLRDPGAVMHDADLVDGLERLLEKIAIAIHVSGEGSVDLRQFVTQWGGAARLLWRASQLEVAAADGDEDASARIGGRSLLRRVGPDSGERWLVDFFHRSMKEYFVAKALRRALNADDPYAATRELLLKAPVQPEILGFFRLLSAGDGDTATILMSLAHSVRVGSGQGILGGGAISLYHAAGGPLADFDWRSLQLDGALLAGADLSGSDLRGSSLRGADLSAADLTGTDLRGADLAGANLEAGGGIIGLAADSTAHRFICLTQEGELGRLTARPDRSLAYAPIPLPRPVRSPRGVYLLREDIVLVAAQGELLVVDIGDGTGTEIAYFRVSGDLRDVAVTGQRFLGLLAETGRHFGQAVLIDLESSQRRWRIPLPLVPQDGASGWLPDGIAVTRGPDLWIYRENNDVSMVDAVVPSPATAMSVSDGRAVLVAEDGRVTWAPLDDTSADLPSLPVHSAPGLAVTGANGEVLSSAADGSVALTERDPRQGPRVVARLERRLRCAGARVAAMRGDRERDILIANGARG